MNILSKSLYGKWKYNSQKKDDSNNVVTRENMLYMHILCTNTTADIQIRKLFELNYNILLNCTIVDYLIMWLLFI